MMRFETVSYLPWKIVLIDYSLRKSFCFVFQLVKLLTIEQTPNVLMMGMKPSNILA